MIILCVCVFTGKSGDAADCWINGIVRQLKQFVSDLFILQQMRDFVNRKLDLFSFEIWKTWDDEL